VSIIPPNFLPTEYQAALARLHHIEDRLLLAGTTGTLLCVGSAAYTLGYRKDLNLGYAWATPIPFLVTTAVLLGLFAWWLGARNQVSALRRQAGFPADLLETNHLASPLLRRMLWIPAVGLCGLYGLTLLFGLRAIYTASRTAGTVFGLIYSLLSLVLILAAWVIWRQRDQQTQCTLAEIRQFFLPDPGDLLLGMGLFSSGFLLPLLTVGLSTAQFPVINALFSRNVEFTTHVPLAAVGALALAYLGVTEGLLVPAGRIWGKLRCGAVIPYGYAQVMARVLLALPMAFLLGGVPLLTLAVLIVAQQLIAGLQPDPVSFGPAGQLTPAQELRLSTHTRFYLLWNTSLASLRFYAGVLAWVGPAWSFTFLLLFFCWAGFLAMGFSAARRARRARLQTVRGETPLPYDLHSAPGWQRAGFVAASLTAAGLVMLQIVAENCDSFNYYLAIGYGQCRNGVVRYALIGPLNGVLLAFDLLLIGLLACAGLVRLLRQAGPRMILLVERVRPILPLLFFVALGLEIAAFVTAIPSLAMGGLLIGTIGTGLWAER
jgi:hypothetical protein